MLTAYRQAQNRLLPAAITPGEGLWLIVDLLEGLYADIEKHSKNVLSGKRASLDVLLTQLAQVEGRNSKIRLSLMDNQRCVE